MNLNKNPGKYFIKDKFKIIVLTALSSSKLPYPCIKSLKSRCN